MRRPGILIAAMLLASSAGLGLAGPASAAVGSGAHNRPGHCHWQHGHHNYWNDWNNRYWDDDWDDDYWYDRHGHCGHGHYRGHRGHGLVGVGMHIGIGIGGH